MKSKTLSGLQLRRWICYTPKNIRKALLIGRIIEIEHRLINDKKVTSITVDSVETRNFPNPEYKYDDRRDTVFIREIKNTKYKTYKSWKALIIDNFVDLV